MSQYKKNGSEQKKPFIILKYYILFLSFWYFLEVQYDMLLTGFVRFNLLFLTEYRMAYKKHSILFNCSEISRFMEQVCLLSFSCLHMIAHPNKHTYVHSHRS